MDMVGEMATGMCMCKCEAMMSLKDGGSEAMDDEDMGEDDEDMGEDDEDMGEDDEDMQGEIDMRRRLQEDDAAGNKNKNGNNKNKNGNKNKNADMDKDGEDADRKDRGDGG